MTHSQKDEIALALFMKKTVLQHSEDYYEMCNYSRNNPDSMSELLNAYLCKLRISRPTQDMKISAIKPYIVDNYFSSLAIGQKDDTSLYQYTLDSLYNIHNALTAFHDPDLSDEVSFTINMVRGLIQKLTNKLISNERIDDYFYKELFIAMDLYDAIISKTQLKEKPVYKKLKK